MYKDIKGYEGRYQVSEEGVIWSCLTNRILKPKEDKDGYYEVCLMTQDGRKKTEKIHRLVALMYCEKEPGNNVVNHIDSNRKNNNYLNLEWTTVKGNTIHGYKYGKVKEAQQKATQAAKLKNTYMITVYKNDEIYGVFYGKEAAAKALGINPKTIYNSIKNNRMTRDGYKFSVTKR